MIEMSANPAHPSEHCISDEDILNFVLNIAYLKTSYYAAAFGDQDLGPGDIGVDAGTVGGGGPVDFSNPLIKTYASEISGQERKHVRLLRQLIGSSAVSRPDLDLRQPFDLFGQTSFGQSFTPFINDTNFLLGSYVFEDVGVTAYRSALSRLQDRSHVEAVIEILITEAHHAALIRSSLFATQDPLVFNVTMAIAQTRSALANNGDPGVDDVGIGSQAKSQITNLLQDGRIPHRDFSQILNILYGDIGRIGRGGAFFPNGMNGRIR